MNSDQLLQCRRCGVILEWRIWKRYKSYGGSYYCPKCGSKSHLNDLKLIVEKD